MKASPAPAMRPASCDWPCWPDIQEAILNSTHPVTLTLADFMDPFPQVWELQRKQYGFENPPLPRAKGFAR